MFNFLRKPVPVPVERQEPVLKISQTVLARAKAPKKVIELKRYDPPPGVVPEKERPEALAMDRTNYQWLNEAYPSEYFPGYPYLAFLMQRPEFRKMAETIARELTRKWIRIVATGDDKTDKVNQLEAALLKYKLREAFYQVAEYDGGYGRGQLYIDVTMPESKNMRAFDDFDELKTPLLRDPAKITVGSLRGFVPVEPVWTYPGPFNSDQPLRPDFYRPESWYVMGKTVHHSRMMTFISRDVPDLLKAAYNFGGLSLSQMAEPYVDNWIRTRDSVGDIVHSYSVSILKTNMQNVLQGKADESIFDRAELFNQTRDNRGLMMLDMENEEYVQVNTPLSGLADLQAQAQEQQAAVSSIPLVFLLGITPKGLNASSEGEILVFESTIHALEEKLFGEHLTAALQIIQLSEFGEIDPDITFEFVRLRELTELEAAQVRNADADADSKYITAGVVSPEEVRTRLANDPESSYFGLDLSDEIEGIEDEQD